MTGAPKLVDAHGRVHDYLRISVTDKCNLRCRYCMPARGITPLSHVEVLRNGEFLRLMKVFRDLGIKKIRFTGGEPFVRRGLMDLLSEAAELLPGTELCLTTNGLLLEENLERLKKIGLRKINISLDSLSPERFRDLTGSDAFSSVIKAIDRAASMGAFDIKVNAVLFKETLSELDAFLDFFDEKKATLRFIEQMPIAGVDDLEFISAERIITELQKRGNLVRNGPGDTKVARMYHFSSPGRGVISVGVIPPISDKFCINCNRVRLSCNGTLRVCLCGEVSCDLRKPLREGADDSALAALIRRCLDDKPLEHRISCGESTRTCLYLPSMSEIGG